MFKWFKKGDVSATPDFSEIDSLESAVKYYRNGSLVKMYLFPLEFGGVDDSRNIVYVPQFAVDLKQRFDSMVMDLLQKGLVSNYSGTPKYKGRSFIPSAIELKVSGESSFEEVINIW